MTSITARSYAAMLLAATLAVAGCAAHPRRTGDPPVSRWVGISDASGNPAAVDSTSGGLKTLVAGPLPAGTNQVGTVLTTPAAVSDPCNTTARPKSVAVINIAAASTVELVAAAASKYVYVCGFALTLNGTAPTIEFLSGTKTTTACDTSPTPLTGVMAPTAGTPIGSGGTGSGVFTSIASGELCATVGGTSPSAQGYVTFVQQ
jgi:hypothetical protein